MNHPLADYIQELTGKRKQRQEKYQGEEATSRVVSIYEETTHSHSYRVAIAGISLIQVIQTH